VHLYAQRGQVHGPTCWLVSPTRLISSLLWPDKGEALSQCDHERCSYIYHLLLEIFSSSVTRRLLHCLSRVPRHPASTATAKLLPRVGLLSAALSLSVVVTHNQLIWLSSWPGYSLSRQHQVDPGLVLTLSLEVANSINWSSRHSERLRDNWNEVHTKEL
jgi:hypothetical protein